MVPLTAKAITKLNSLLKLPYMDWMQDWDVVLADPNRVKEFCDVYSIEPLEADEKQALMGLIISSYDDYLNEHGEEANLWTTIVSLIEKDYDLHEETIEYWSDLDNDTSEMFAVTPRIRELRDSIMSQRQSSK
jgi:hypothetical protein